MVLKHLLALFIFDLGATGQKLAIFLHLLPKLWKDWTEIHYGLRTGLAQPPRIEMKVFIKSWFVLSASLMFALLATGCMSPKAAFLHPQFSERIEKIHRVQVVLQSPADIRRMGYYGHLEPETNQSAVITTRLPGTIGAQLDKRAFQIYSLPKMTVDSNVEAQAQMCMLTWRSNVWWKISTNGESGLAAKAKLLATQEHVDGIVFVQCWGKVNTPARDFREGVVETFGVVGLIVGAVGGDPEAGAAILGGTAWLLTGDGKMGALGEVATVEVVFVDGDSGEILWADWFSESFTGPALDVLAADVFQTFPIGSPPRGHYRPKRNMF